MLRSPRRPSAPRRAPLSCALAAACAAVLLGVPGPVSAAPVVQGQAPPPPGKPSPPSKPAPPAPPAAPPAAASPGVPGAPAAPKDERRAMPDPTTTLGARSPDCVGSAGTYDVPSGEPGPVARRNCRASGSIAHPYPMGRYSLDVHMDTSAISIEGNFWRAVHGIVEGAWALWLAILKFGTLAVEWAFSLDILRGAMAPVRQALRHLHGQVFGQPWFMAALSVTAIWGIYSGYVRRRVTQTLMGLAVTVACMVGALLLINRPDQTVGQVNAWANDASLQVLTVGAKSRVGGARESLAGAMQGFWSTQVVKPWCALQFGSVTYCEKVLRSGNPPLTVADVWLSFPVGSEGREAVYKLTKGEEPEGFGRTDKVRDKLGPLGIIPSVGLGLHLADRAEKALRGAVGAPTAGSAIGAQLKPFIRKAPERVEMMEQPGALPRVAMLAYISLGLVGAMLLYLYLAVRVLLAGIMSLLLLLFAPLMLFAPAFGDSGRATFVRWGRHLVSALISKFIYALFLALVFLTSSLLGSIPSTGWYGGWALQIVFTWGVLLKRKWLVGWLQAAPGLDRESRENERRHVSPAATAFYARQALRPLARTRAARRGGGRAPLPLPRAALDPPGSKAADVRERAQHLAGGEMASAREALHGRDREVVGADDRRRDLGRQIAVLAAKGAHPSSQAGRQLAAKRAEHEALGRRLDGVDLAAARRRLQAYDARAAEHGVPHPRSEYPRDLEAYQRDRRNGVPLDHARMLERFGIAPDDYERQAPERQTQIKEGLERRAAAWDRVAAGAPPERPVTSGEQRQARGMFNPEALGQLRRQQSETDRLVRRLDAWRASVSRRPS